MSDLWHDKSKDAELRWYVLSWRDARWACGARTGMCCQFFDVLKLASLVAAREREPVLVTEEAREVARLSPFQAGR